MVSVGRSMGSVVANLRPAERATSPSVRTGGDLTCQACVDRQRKESAPEKQAEAEAAERRADTAHSQRRRSVMYVRQ